MADFVYGHDDALAAFDSGFTSRIGDGSGGTEEALHTAILSAAACKAGGRFLDIGSGFGRIVGMLQPFAGHLVGVEPDRDRFNLCLARNARLRNVRILNATTAVLPRGRRQRLDLVTVSMVLQHVSTSACRQILDDVRALLRPTGVALIATTHFTEQRFTCQQRETPLPRTEFDAYAERSGSQTDGLPVRLFDRAAFENALEEAGLAVQAWQQFYYARPGMRDALARFYDLPPSSLETVGLSQYALVTGGDPVPRTPMHRLSRWLDRRAPRMR